MNGETTQMFKQNVEEELLNGLEPEKINNFRNVNIMKISKI
jgi:hypothetical protein